jgi:hypothetical protein
MDGCGPVPRYPHLPAQTGMAQTTFSDVDDFSANDAAQKQWDTSSSYAVPDTILIAFRIIALTTLAGAAYVLVGISKRESIG